MPASGSLSSSRPIEIIIFVIGPSGAGCSTFINAASGQDPGVPVGKPGSLRSVTKRITRVECIHPDRPQDYKITFIDLPALNCDPVSPALAMANIKEWLRRNWTASSKFPSPVGAVLYLHRITDPRVAESPEVSLKIFKKLFPHDPPEIDVLVTTMWNGCRDQAGAEQRHLELSKSFSATFGTMGQRFDKTKESALEAIDSVVDRLEKSRNIDQESVIVILGPTGSGKTSFVKKLLGTSDEVEGQTLTSCTNRIDSFKTAKLGTRKSVILVDTPGFDSSELSNPEILNILAEYLNDLYRKGTKLSGIMYFHRISDNRMSSDAVASLGLFEGLCGQHGAPNVCFVTTMWDEIVESVGETNENELVSDYWQPMIAAGAEFTRYSGTVESARGAINRVLRRQPLKGIQLQEEMVDLRMSLGETQAGAHLHDTLTKLVATKQTALRILRTRLTELSNTNDLRGYIFVDEEIDRLQDELEGMLKQLKGMRVGFRRRLLARFRTVPRTERVPQVHRMPASKSVGDLPSTSAAHKNEDVWGHFEG